MRGIIGMVAGMLMLGAPMALAEPNAPAGAEDAHGFSFDGIAGKTVSLSDYAGQVVLVVNTASKCGFTGQYDALQALYEAHQEDGLVVLGVPSDSFDQELSTDDAVQDFCAVNFNLTFPMTGITPVTGDASHPFYQWVRAETGKAGFPGWNFNKVLLNREGAIIDTYGSRSTLQLNVNALQKNLVQAVETALATPAS